MLDHCDAKEGTKAPPAPEPTSRHRAYVGPGERYDIMGATQFALLTAQSGEARATYDLYLASAELARSLGRPIPFPPSAQAQPTRRSDDGAR